MNAVGVELVCFMFQSSHSISTVRTLTADDRDISPVEILNNVTDCLGLLTVGGYRAKESVVIRLA